MKKYFKKVVHNYRGDIFFLEYIFEDNFKGAVGTIFNPISKEGYNERLSKQNVKKYLEDCGYFDDEDFIFESEEEKDKEIDFIFNNENIEDIIFDLSYEEYWDEIRNEFPEYSDEEKYPLFGCVGCGRIFDENFQGNINKELSDYIRTAEKS